MTGSQAEPEARRAGGDGEPVVSLLAEERYTLRRPSGREAGEDTGRVWSFLEFWRPFFSLKKAVDGEVRSMSATRRQRTAVGLE